MNVRLTPEQSSALANGQQLEVIDPATNRVYVLVDRTELSDMEVQRRKEDLDSIRAGIADMKAGRYVTLEESHQRIRERLDAEYGE